MQKQMFQLKSTLQSGRNINWDQGHMCDSTRECTWFQRQGVVVSTRNLGVCGPVELPHLAPNFLFQHLSALCGPLCGPHIHFAMDSQNVRISKKPKTSPPPHESAC